MNLFHNSLLFLFLVKSINTDIYFKDRLKLFYCWFTSPVKLCVNLHVSFISCWCHLSPVVIAAVSLTKTYQLTNSQQREQIWQRFWWVEVVYNRFMTHYFQLSSIYFVVLCHFSSEIAWQRFNNISLYCYLEWASVQRSLYLKINIHLGFRSCFPFSYL